VDLSINETVISRKHCRLARDQDRYYLEDLASRNGTFLGDKDEKLTGINLVRDSDRIQIGIVWHTLAELRALATPSQPDESTPRKTPATHATTVTLPAKQKGFDRALILLTSIVALMIVGLVVTIIRSSMASRTETVASTVEERPSETETRFPNETPGTATPETERDPPESAETESAETDSAETENTPTENTPTPPSETAGSLSSPSPALTGLNRVRDAMFVLVVDQQGNDAVTRRIELFSAGSPRPDFQPKQFQLSELLGNSNRSKMRRMTRCRVRSNRKRRCVR